MTNCELYWCYLMLIHGLFTKLYSWRIVHPSQKLEVFMEEGLETIPWNLRRRYLNSLGNQREE